MKPVIPFDSLPCDVDVKISTTSGLIIGIANGWTCHLCGRNGRALAVLWPNHEVGTALCLRCHKPQIKAAALAVISALTEDSLRG